MYEVITSHQNGKIKNLKKLYSTSQRRKKKKYVLEGFRIVQEALNADCKIQRIFMTQEFLNSDYGKSIRERVNEALITVVDKKLFEKIADTYNPQGITAVVNEKSEQKDRILKQSGFILLLDRIQDPGNMGTIIRTAAAAGLDAVIALKGSVDIYNLKVLRSTMGAIFEIPVLQNMGFEEFRAFYQNYQEKFTLIGSGVEGDNYYYEADFTVPTIIVIGNEANGICPQLKNICDLLVKIPLMRKTESLNAAVAAGIISYEAVEQRLKSKT